MNHSLPSRDDLIAIMCANVHFMAEGEAIHFLGFDKAAGAVLEAVALVVAAHPKDDVPAAVEATPREKALTDWVRAAMRFIDLCDADPADYADRELHEDAEQLILNGFRLFFGPTDADQKSLADLEYQTLQAFAAERSGVSSS